MLGCSDSWVLKRRLNWIQIVSKGPWAWILSEASAESNLPVTFNGIFTSTNVTQWRINSTITQNVWRAAKPFIPHYFAISFVLRWNVIVYIEKNKWPPSGYAQRCKPKFLSSMPTQTRPNYPSIWKMLYINWNETASAVILLHTFILKSFIPVILVALRRAPSNPYVQAYIKD